MIQATPVVATDRRILFISHANPEDNAMTLWLATRLASAGYEVWSDLTKLIGGELFWQDIETAIRVHAAKFISLISNASAAKPGFLDELSIATSIERADGLGDFVIPCRIDDFNFTNLPAQLHRKNAIDLSDGWHAGLSRLLEKMEKDGVPRQLEAATDMLSAWSKHFLKVDANLAVADEVVASNWLPILEWPASVRMSSRNTDESVVREAFPWPVAPIAKSEIASFAAAFELYSGSVVAVKPVLEVVTDAFLNGVDRERRGLTWSEARNTMADLARQAWERYCKTKGLLAAELSNGRLCWYAPLGRSGLASVSYIDLDGTRRKKKLIGHSAKHQVYWHCAVEAFSSIGNSSHLTLVLHVIFTEDGQTPLDSPARAHRLRRSFCKSWWQWQWRELMLAFLAHVAGTDDVIGMPVSQDRQIRIGARPLKFVAPVSTPLAHSPEEDLDEPLPSDDELVGPDWEDDPDELMDLRSASSESDE